MPLDLECGSDPARGLDLDRVALTVVDGEGMQRETICPGNGGGRVRVEPTAQEHDGRRVAHTPLVVGDQMYLCSCSWSLAGT